MFEFLQNTVNIFIFHADQKPMKGDIHSLSKLKNTVIILAHLLTLNLLSA